MTAATEKATFGAGCFWGVEVEFRNTPGVFRKSTSTPQKQPAANVAVSLCAFMTSPGRVRRS